MMNFKKVESFVHYPVRKEIVEQLDPEEIKQLGLFIRDLLKEVAFYRSVWNPKADFSYRKTWADYSWSFIKQNLQVAGWGDQSSGFIKYAVDIFLDQRHKFYCDFIDFYQYAPEANVKEFAFLEQDAPVKYNELFYIVLVDRLIYPSALPLKCNPQVEEFDASSCSDQSDEDLWRVKKSEPRKEEETDPVREEPNYDDCQDDLYERLMDSVVPAMENIGNKVSDIGKGIFGAVKKFWDEIEVREVETVREPVASTSSAPATVVEIPLDLLDSNGKKVEAEREAITMTDQMEQSTSEQNSTAKPPVTNTRIIFPVSVERKLDSSGAVYYLSNFTKSISRDDPREWGPLPRGWVQRRNAFNMVYYYNPSTRVTQFVRPTVNDENEPSTSAETCTESRSIFGVSVERKLDFFGNVYYLNKFTKETSLDNPKERSPLPSGWVQRSNAWKMVYYTNPESGEYQLNRPTTRE